MHQDHSAPAYTIVDFQPEHASAFRQLNEAWIREYFRIEERDELSLGDPQAYFVTSGGRVFVAQGQSGEVLGVVALKAMDDGGFELAKLAVDQSARGGGVARALCQACIDHARARGAWRVYIETNAVLAPALRLYESLGFEAINPGATPYERCNVWLELRF